MALLIPIASGLFMRTQCAQEICAWERLRWRDCCTGVGPLSALEVRIQWHDGTSCFGTSLADVDGQVFLHALTCPRHFTVCCWIVFSAIESLGYPPPHLPKQSSHAMMSKTLTHWGFRTCCLPSPGLAHQVKQFTRVSPLSHANSFLDPQVRAQCQVRTQRWMGYPWRGMTCLPPMLLPSQDTPTPHNIIIFNIKL